MRRIREEVRLWSAGDLAAALQEAGLQVLHRWGDYDGQPFDAATSRRLVLHARRLPA